MNMGEKQSNHSKVNRALFWKIILKWIRKQKVLSAILGKRKESPSMAPMSCRK
jgi:hypothetical protein